MDQLWCLIYTVSAEELSTSDVQLIRQLLGTLHSHGVDWTDPSAWPEDYVDGHWERQIPIPFLLEQHKPGRRNLKVVQAFCEGNPTALIGSSKCLPPDFTTSAQYACKRVLLTLCVSA